MKLLSACAAVACIAPCVLGIAAADTGSAGPLTLTEAIATALERNPELQGGAYALRAADARIEQANLRPNPELAVELENFAGTGELRGIDALETTLSLSQVIELGDKRSRRVEVAHAERDIVAAERDVRQLDVIAEVAERFIAVVQAQEQLSLARDVEQLSTATLRAVAQRIAAARSPEAERSRAQIASIRARLDRERAAQSLDTSRRALVALWGEGEPRFTHVVADLQRLPPPQPFDRLAERLERNPDFLLLASESRLRTAELRLTQAQSRPSLHIGAGLRRLEAPDDIGLVAAFSLPLQVAGRNRAAIAEAEARVSLNDAQREAALVRARATLYALHRELATARAEAQALRDEIIPLAEQTLALIDEGFRLGRLSYLELGTAQRDLIDARQAAIVSAAEAQRLRTEVERFTGEPLADELHGEDHP
jgi:cobalt-zinc-cadmium efflux system outer membrane protein